MRVATHTITDAVLHLQMMSDEDRLDIFKHIDLMLLKYEKTADLPKKKRTAGTLSGKSGFWR